MDKANKQLLPCHVSPSNQNTSCHILNNLKYLCSMLNIYMYICYFLSTSLKENIVLVFSFT